VYCHSHLLHRLLCRSISGNLKKIDAVARADSDMKILSALYSIVSASLGYGTFQGSNAAEPLPLEM
jgi:hypothetical protein